MTEPTAKFPRKIRVVAKATGVGDLPELLATERIQIRSVGSGPRVESALDLKESDQPKSSFAVWAMSSPW
jgi:hypothetical protein